MAQWTYYANVDFTQAHNRDDAMIRIGFKPNDGSWSFVGTDAERIKRGQVTMNLACIADRPTVSDRDRGIILHEWGHALGLAHEHQSPARRGTLTLDQNNTYTYYRRVERLSDDQIKSQILEMENVNDVSSYSTLDITSIMMYSMPSCINTEGISVPVNNELSDMDKAYIFINYPRKEPHPNAKDWTLKRALTVAGVPAKEIVAYLGLDDEGIRRDFNAWNILQRDQELSEPSIYAQSTGEKCADEGTR
ncbi:hypothetical protein H0H81_010075 [Sphagnurus paluster]|uniref:Peptidase M12A domain-containing protein n=1 Tax=Sphagnurus paluster TaxID=117069 RepID=A0A9P7K3V5_9AGAR|nr:hypothetical protein H0H81_010075 [Sphagnurus paluster]